MPSKFEINLTLIHAPRSKTSSFVGLTPGRFPIPCFGHNQAHSKLPCSVQKVIMFQAFPMNRSISACQTSSILNRLIVLILNRLRKLRRCGILDYFAINSCSSRQDIVITQFNIWNSADSFFLTRLIMCTVFLLVVTVSPPLGQFCLSAFCFPLFFLFPPVTQSGEIYPIFFWRTPDAIHVLANFTSFCFSAVEFDIGPNQFLYSI